MHTAEKKTPECIEFNNISVHLGCEVNVAVTEKGEKSLNSF